MDNSNNFVPAAANDSSENASFVAMTTVNQMMPPVALYSAEVPFSSAHMMSAGYSNMDYSNTIMNNNYMNQSHITSTPVVKSHQNTGSNMYSSPPNGYAQGQQSLQHHTDFMPMAIDTRITSVPTTNIMNNLSAMDIDDYFAPTSIDSMFANNIYSPSTNSVTTNSSVIMMDTMSPSSPTHMLSPNNMMSPASHLMSPTQSMDATFVSPAATSYQHLLITDNISDNIYPEAPIVPTNIGMSHNYSSQHNLVYSNGVNEDMMSQYHAAIQQQQPYFDRKGRRPLPRRHTVSTPYATNMVINNNKGKEPMIENNPEINLSQPQQQQQPAVTKSRKSSLKAKRHRSLGKLDIYATATSPPPIPDPSTFEPLSAKLELWTHEQLLERVMELEKEKEASVAQTSISKLNEVTQDDGGESKATVGNGRPTYVVANKIRSASQTDTELEEDEEEEDPQVCKWNNCSIEFNSLDDLINHVKADHIGSGKANYYCCWKDCARQQKPFTKRHKMHNHLRTHTGERPFVCTEPDCGKKFSRPDSLTTHAKIHSNIRPYLCNNPDCGKAYYHLRSLRKHERTHLQKHDTTPPPLPVPVVMSSVTHTAIHPDDHCVTQREEVFSDWGLSAQAAVFNVMERGNTTYT
ncbi:unnamed protein product [Mucor hiemalis]